MPDDNGFIVSTLPPGVKRIHLVGVAGTGMGSFGGLLKAAGYQVSGSDENVYPPMSDMLKTWGIQVLTPYAESNLEAARPDLVVVGNVIRRVNPEATAVRTRRLPQMSFPAALGALFLPDKHAVVVVGTHGKTTTSSMMSHVLTSAGRDPSFLVGGVTKNYAGNFRLGSGKYFVIEGDEYDTAYFDKGPKFLHYQPQTAILTSIEFDHADIYRDLPHYEAAFSRFIELLPPAGLLAVSATYPNAVLSSRSSKAKVVTYSAVAPAEFQATSVVTSIDGVSFELVRGGKKLGRVELAMSGLHNVENTLGVITAALGLGLSFDEIQKGLRTFEGIKRRQELRGDIAGRLVIDDFAHHPTAVRETIAAIHARYPQRRLLAVFEPRSNTSRRNIHQQEYAAAFDEADAVFLRAPEKHDKVPTNEELDVVKLIADIQSRGVVAAAEAQVPVLVRIVARASRRGDVILVMSNGSFGGFIDQLILALPTLEASQ